MAGPKGNNTSGGNLGERAELQLERWNCCVRETAIIPPLPSKMATEFDIPWDWSRNSRDEDVDDEESGGETTCEFICFVISIGFVVLRGLAIS